jgi:hypothetical protein
MPTGTGAKASRVLDMLLLTLNVLALGVLIAATYNSFARGRQSYSVWHERAPWLPLLMGTLFAASTVAVMLVIYWLGYWWVGIPSWMRWVVGNL